MTAQGPSPAALGFAPHSGWAALVALGGSAAEPEVLVRARVEMAEPGLAGAKQPYHAVEGLPPAEAERRLSRYLGSANAMAYSAVASILADLRRRGYAAKAAGILDSSGRQGATLASILSSHALIHTADGDHFRTALVEACGRCQLAVVRIRGRELHDRAARGLGRSAQALQASVQAHGRRLGPPWGLDQKQAALLAWLLLRGKSGARV